MMVNFCEPVSVMAGILSVCDGGRTELSGTGDVAVLGDEDSTVAATGVETSGPMDELADAGLVASDGSACTSTFRGAFPFEICSGWLWFRL